jgi:hypothetical protein
MIYEVLNIQTLISKKKKKKKLWNIYLLLVLRFLSLIFEIKLFMKFTCNENVLYRNMDLYIFFIIKRFVEMIYGVMILLECLGKLIDWKGFG